VTQLSHTTQTIETTKLNLLGPSCGYDFGAWSVTTWHRDAATTPMQSIACKE
jgi:hypothetical protein